MQDFLVIIAICSLIAAAIYFPVAMLLAVPFAIRVKKLVHTVPELERMREKVPKVAWALYVLRISLLSKRMGKTPGYRPYKAQLKKLNLSIKFWEFCLGKTVPMGVFFFFTGCTLLFGINLFHNVVSWFN